MLLGVLLCVPAVLAAGLVTFACWPTEEEAEAAFRERAREYIRSVFWAVNGDAALLALPHIHGSFRQALAVRRGGRKPSKQGGRRLRKRQKAAA